MLTLNPTLEHTCRMLASVPRLRLLRLVCAHPGLAVFELARQAGVHVSGASQDLHRLHSCGLLQRVTPTGERRVTYLPKAAPSIPNAAPILKAIQATFRKHPPARDPETAAIAAALAHPRRIAILTELLNGPRNIHALQAALQCPLRTLYHHLNIIQDGKMLERARLMYRVANNPHPLAKCLLGLLLEPQHMPSK